MKIELGVNKSSGSTERSGKQVPLFIKRKLNKQNMILSEKQGVKAKGRFI